MPKKILAINTLLFAALFGLVTLNKKLLRPALDEGFMGILTGCFPNFIAAFLISLAFTNAVLIRQPRYGRLIVYLASLAVFSVLALEEIRPMWGASTHYDPYDILASGLGSVLVVLIYELAATKGKKHS
jgi:hypothetical protein